MNAKTDPGQIDSQVIDNFSPGLPTGVTKRTHTYSAEIYFYCVHCLHSTRLESILVPLTRAAEGYIVFVRIYNSTFNNTELLSRLFQWQQ